jgi:hypothetical protein
MAQDDNDAIPELEEPGNDRAVADDEGMDDQAWEEDENELSDEEKQNLNDGTGF